MVLAMSDGTVRLTVDWVKPVPCLSSKWDADLEDRALDLPVGLCPFSYYGHELWTMTTRSPVLTAGIRLLCKVAVLAL